jgi:AICAR transformylase/IMP cyclohydrolase PurH
MVKAIVEIDDRTNRVLNIIKAKHSLKDKSQAINLMAHQFEEIILEPELKPEFIESLKASKNEKTIKVNDFTKRYTQ